MGGEEGVGLRGGGGGGGGRYSSKPTHDPHLNSTLYAILLIF